MSEENVNLEQEEYENALHSIVYPELDEEPELDPELEEEIDALIWEAIKDLE